MVERRQADEGSATSPNVYNALVQSISTVTPILEAFNHRHSNQHAAAHWWATFNTLRRRTRKLYITARTASRLQGRKLLRYHTRVLGESNHLLHHTIPQAYITSTQLAADNQHAPLGLLLLTCIAQINAAVQETMAETSRPAPLTIPKDNNSEGGSITASENNTSTVEKGLTVPRGDVASSSKLGKKPSLADKTKHASASKTADTGKQRDRTNDKDKSRKQKKKKAKKGGHDEFSSLFGSLK